VDIIALLGLRWFCHTILSSCPSPDCTPCIGHDSPIALQARLLRCRVEDVVVAEEVEGALTSHTTTRKRHLFRTSQLLPFL
jgi:hypothetical protein